MSKTTYTTRQIEAMTSAICSNSQGLDFACGTRDADEIERIAKEWIGAGMTPSQTSDWLDAGCFVANEALNMARVGITPKMAKATCPKLEGYSWAYAYANGDVSLAAVQEACL